MNESFIIDCHSHIGKDYFWREANIDEYLSLLDFQNIDMALLMPVPGPVVYGDAFKRYFIWKNNELGELVYFSEYYNDRIYNPYEIVNDYTYNIIMSAKTSKDLNFIPLVHPLLDTSEYLLSLIENYNPLAFKIHGVACGIGPDDIPVETIKILKMLDLPIIVHTDYCDNPKSNLDIMRRKNNPYDWACFFINNDLKGYLTHGCRVDLRTLKLVNSYDNLVVGIGPDLKISQERFRWVNAMENNEYLELLKNELDINKILFDIDYSWNINNNDDIDFKSIDRISNYFNENEKHKVLSKNAIKFFNIKMKGSRI